MTPDVSVVTVSHGHAAFLPACLDALAPGRLGVRAEVFVVANLAGDGTAELVRARYPWVRLLESPRPRGFSANNNAALRESCGRHALLLNPDTAPQPGAVERLVAYADADPGAGICGPQLRFPDGRIQPSARRFPRLATVVARRTPLRRWLQASAANRRHLMEDLDASRLQPVDWLLGACLLVRRELLRDVGLLDEGYFLYVEDIDWAHRAWAGGWRVMYVPDAVVVHHHRAVSDRVLLGRHSWLHAQSMWRYFRKHLAPAPLRLRVEPERLP